jgi:hypothetical protein
VYALLLVAQFLDRDRGPDQTGDFSMSPTALFLLLGVGFMVGVFGHIIRSKTVIAIGIGMIFLATVLLPIGLNAVN